MSSDERPSIQRFTLAILAAYAGLMGLAVVWSLLRNHVTLPWTPSPAGALEPGWTALIGVASGLTVAFSSQLSVKFFSWARKLEREFANLLGPMSWSEILLVAVFSSIAEETFFRGVMQSELGLCLTSLIFGILHTGPKRVFLPWTAMAVAMGFALGGMFVLTGSLLAPILCHGLINAINLRRIALTAEQLQARSRTV